jgi:hypothetical protein
LNKLYLETGDIEAGDVKQLPPVTMETQEVPAAFQSHHPSQNLVRTDGLVGGFNPVPAEEEPSRRAQTHHPMGDDMISVPIQENIPSPDFRCIDGFHGYKIAVLNGGSHAHAMGAEAYGPPVPKKLGAHFDEGLVGIHRGSDPYPAYLF